MSANIFPIDCDSVTFTADEARAAGVVCDWISFADNETWAGFEFTTEQEEQRIFATILVDIEDEQGYVTRHHHSWHDTEEVMGTTLAELMSAR